MPDAGLDAIQKRLEHPKPFLEYVLKKVCEECLEVLKPNMYGKLGEEWTHEIHVDADKGEAMVYHKRLEADRATWEPIFGWHNRGTPDHPVAPKIKKALHWIDKETGEDRFSMGHDVKGIKPKYFAEKTDKVAEQFEKTLNRRWKTWIETGRLM
jgi:hypothetical protein